MKVLFLGNGSIHSLEAEKHLKRMQCEVVYGHNNSQKFSDWKQNYDLGISFLYAFKVLYFSVLYNVSIKSKTLFFKKYPSMPVKATVI